MSTHEVEQQVMEAGYTLGELNRREHNVIALNTGLLSVETGHLRYEQGRGVVKIEEATCSVCETWGLNDGRWHTVPSREAKQ